MALRHTPPLHAAGALARGDRAYLRSPLAGLEEAIQFGQAEFPAFAERNPWIGLDSLQQKIWILLDPEAESTR